MILISVYNTQEPERSMYERILYKLLQERKPHQNISHKEMPSYENHQKFIRSEPYKEHWLVYNGKLPVGSIYLSKNNEIGIFIFEEFHGKGWGTKALNFVMKRHKKDNLFANIAPNNHKSINFFKRHGFHYYLEDQIDTKQYTYSKKYIHFTPLKNATIVPTTPTAPIK